MIDIQQATRKGTFKMNRLAALTIILGAGLATQAGATTTWNFAGSGPLDLGTATKTNGYSVVSGGVTVTAYAFNDPTTASDVSQNSSGIGVFTNSSNFEITDTNYVTINISGIAENTLLSLSVAGAGTSDPYNVYFGSAKPNGSPNGQASPTCSDCTLLVSGDVTSPLQFQRDALASEFITIQLPTTGPANSSVMVGSLSTLAPEPGYYAALALGLAGLFVIARRRVGRTQLKADSLQG
jgi:hypothetical protein